MDETAEYTLIWEADWNVNDHQDMRELPGNAHFTTLIGTTHQAGAAFWKPGETASAGVEDVAELGLTTALSGELSALNSQGVAGDVILLGSVFSFPTTLDTTFTVGNTLPEVTLITMIAPSPDWFVGVSGLSLQQNGQWLDEVTVDLLPWDAGTENGASFRLANAATDPQAGISLLSERASPFESTATLGQLRFVRSDVVNDGPKFTSVSELGVTAKQSAKAYVGPVSFLQYELVGDASAEVIIGSAFNDFLSLSAGDDAASGGDGQDVLDGGTGSNFLTGGNGADIFFLDGRGGLITWSTITDFDGDQVSIWGWVDGTSRLLSTEENAGAAGFEGATYHYDLNNDGTIDTSITFSGLSVSEVPDATVGLVEGSTYLSIS